MEVHFLLLTLGGLLLVGLVADEIGRRTRWPRVTLLILVGIGIGPSGLDLLPRTFQAWYEPMRLPLQVLRTWVVATWLVPLK
jgi:NhaP-type Na+/H+ or K+/H+ antiporter